MSKTRIQLKQLRTFASQRIHPRPRCSPSTFRLSTFGLLLTFNLSLIIIQSCGLDIEDPTPPSPPVWVQKSLPEEWPERGIDAHESGGIYLEWEASTEEDIASYLIYSTQYYSVIDSLGEYEVLVTIETSLSFYLEYLDSEVLPSEVHFYKIKAKNSAGNISEFSEAIQYSLHNPINSEMMSPNGQDALLEADRTLIWQNYYTNTTENYILTIINKSNEKIVRIELQPKSYFGGIESWTIPDSLYLRSGLNYKWRIDTGADYVNKCEKSGSESTWAIFLYSIN
jgi:hypothetical protein